MRDRTYLAASRQLDALGAAHEVARLGARLHQALLFELAVGLHRGGDGHTLRQRRGPHRRQALTGLERTAVDQLRQCLRDLLVQRQGGDRFDRRGRTQRERGMGRRHGVSMLTECRPPQGAHAPG